MSMKINHELPLPEVLKSQYPLSQELKEVKKQRDEEIRRIFTGESDKFIVLVGPCSADNEDTVCEYVRKLKTVADKVSDKLMKHSFVTVTCGTGLICINSRDDHQFVRDFICHCFQSANMYAN